MSVCPGTQMPGWPEGLPVAGTLIKQANAQQGSRLDQGGEFQLRQQRRKASRQVEEEHFGDGGITAGPLGSCHAQQHSRSSRIMLLAQITVQVCGCQAREVTCAN